MKSFLVGLQFLTRRRLDTQTEWKDEDFGKSVTWTPVMRCFLFDTTTRQPSFDWVYFGYIGTFYYRGIIA